jgi:hypothetical protein
MVVHRRPPASTDTRGVNGGIDDQLVTEAQCKSKILIANLEVT